METFSKSTSGLTHVNKFVLHHQISDAAQSDFATFFDALKHSSSTHYTASLRILINGYHLRFPAI
jgi:hypothetical protein